MRILRVADIFDSRSTGMGRAMHCTGDHLEAKGHHVEYLFREQLQLRCPLRWRRFLVPWKVLQWVGWRMRQGAGYDVVEIHEPIAAPYCLRRRIGVRLPPVVVFSHGLEERGRLAELAYRKRKALPTSLRRRYLPLSVVWQAMYAVRHANQVLCCSGEDADYLERAGIPAWRLTRYQNGVERSFLQAGAGQPKQCERGRVLFLGGWLERKGNLDLVPAMTEVLRDEPLARLTVAGCAVDEATVLREFDARVQSRIDVIPSIESDAALIAIYARHSILVLPSYFEGQPLVMLEAAALGLGIIATDICGVRDFLVTECNGLTIPVGQPRALAAAVTRLVADETVARRLGEAARRDAQSFTWAASAERIAGAYQQAAMDA